MKAASSIGAAATAVDQMSLTVLNQEHAAARELWWGLPGKMGSLNWGGDLQRHVSRETHATEDACFEQMCRRSNELTVSPSCMVVNFVHVVPSCISFSAEQQHGRNSAC